MIVIRMVKAALVAAIALLASLVAFGNLTDYGTNFAFVQHVMSMDTIYPFSTIRYRAISAPALHHAAYALIITAEVITALLCWIGAVLLALQIRADAGQGTKNLSIPALHRTLSRRDGGLDAGGRRI